MLLKLENILNSGSSMYLLGLILAIIILLIQPYDFKKYNVISHESYPKSETYQIFWYDDLDLDGHKEYFRMGNSAYADNSLYLMVYNSKEQVIDQFNFSHPRAKSFLEYIPLSTDVNGDGIKEIFLFTQNNDSLFLNIFDYAHLSIILENRFITTIGGYNSKQDYCIYWITAEDVNGDKLSEVFFSVSAGFALYPRRLFRYDYKNDSLIASINTGAGYLQASPFKTGENLIMIARGNALNNISADYPFPYIDSCAWLFGFDKNLKFIFKPKSFKGSASSIGNIIDYKNNFCFLFGGYNAQVDKNQFIKMDKTGKLLNESDFYVPVSIYFYYFKHLNPNNIYFQHSDDLITNKLNLENYKISSDRICKKLHDIRAVFEEDIDNDGVLEYFLYNLKERTVLLYRKNLKHPVVLPLHIDDGFFKLISTKNDNGTIKIILIGKNQIYNYTYFKNPKYWLKYPFYIGVIILSILFVKIIQVSQKKKIEAQKKQEERIVQLQLQNLRNQLDPHFTFNAMNSIGYHIYEQKKDKAYDYFVRFSRLIRSSLMWSDKIFVPLNEEIQFTEDYLEFQMERFKEKFAYTISVDNSLETTKIKIPKMIIQGYAENAVKHAFEGLNRKGQITINVLKKKELLHIKITDDGVGRAASTRIKTEDSGRGMAAMDEQIDLLNKLQNKKITLKVTDLFNSEKLSTGTAIDIFIDL